ncbi:RNA recognition motif-containing protein [Malassezia pachydermatis]|uniref:Rna-binding domain-containing protein n=1 Tax=Malassezia pachydermatis TaxID=77020 RepID=A0A0M8MT91_9BASI|nr:rna-binding domain-containing protein [Malassezia pachydermatis]KOS13161.1 rna-binding domain-containing protein [Malassezia pachydermatis]
MEGSNVEHAATRTSKPHRKNTLFVTRIPFNVTNTDLETFFSDIGPLRRAFVVTDKETRQSKGVGYVTYTDGADAEKALDKLQGASIDGSKRHIQLQWADQKSTSKEAQSSSVPGAVPSNRRNAALPERDPDAVRTIVISGLSGCNPAADVKTLYKRVRKIGDVEHIAFAEIDGATSTDVAHVLFRTPNHAMQAVPKLHAHQFKGAQLSVELKKRVDNALRRELHMRDDTRTKRKSMQDQIEKFSGNAWSSDSSRLSRDSRLIVRNIPFDMTVEDLRAIFLPYGALYDVSIPTKEAKEGSAKAPQGRGFAFIWFVSKSDAAKAIDAVNGVELRHGAAEQALLKKAQGKKGRDAAKEALAQVHKTAQPARPVAVDWSLSQKDWLAQAEDNEAEPVDAELPISRKRPHEEEEEDEEDSESGDDDSDAEESSSNSMQEDESTTEPPKLAPPEAGTTLFVRNLPYQATEQELKDLFRSFGPLRYARITMDPATKRSRGTGFLCFWKKESADALLHDADIVQRETAAAGVDSSLPKSNPFSVPSVITADPSAPLVARFTLHGRVLHVVRAVTRETAGQLEESARKLREKGDKRNTWLLREGVPFPNTPLAASLSETEIERRMRSFSIRRAQLGANPSLHVSKTRLSVHQLPLFVSNKMLKRLALHALRKFGDEVKAGERTDLDADEKADKTLSSNAKTSDSGKNRPPPSVVVQSKVVLQNERVDPITGRGRSRGYGFLELRSFQHALKVLRWINGNKAVAKLLTQWWREELDALLTKLKVDNSDDARIRAKRVESVLQDLEDKGKSEARGVLRLEFSIENIITVRKRTLRQEQARDHATKRRKLSQLALDETPESIPTTEPSEVHSASPPKKLGSLIGKKRAMRKKKRAMS